MGTFAAIWFERMAWTSMQAALLFAVLWALMRFVPRLAPAMRCTLWWLLGAQLLIGLTVGTPLRLPVLAPAAPVALQVSELAVPVTIQPIAVTPTSPATVAISQASPQPLDWRLALFALWLAALAVQLLWVLRQGIETRRSLRASRPLQDLAVRALCRQQARELGLRRCPRLRVSDDIASPQVMGLLSPVVLLPTDHALTPEESAMAIAHELAHIRRGDLWLGWVPALAQRLFFFHPLARLATREYALHREAACDAHVMRQQHTQAQTYGRLLLRLGVAQPLPSGLAGASPTFQTLKRRLTMLQQSVNDTSPRTRGWLLVVLVALAGVLPYRLTEASGMTVHEDAQDGEGYAIAATAPTPNPQPDTKPTPTSDAEPAYVIAPAPPPPPPPPAPTPVPPAPPVPPVPHVPPVPAVPPVPPVPPVPDDAEGFHADNVQLSINDNAKVGLALISKDHVLFDGDSADLAKVRSLRDGDKSMVWFRRNGNAYVVRDAAFVERAQGAYAPLVEIARMQGELAGQDGRLAGEDGGLAAREGSLAARQGGLAAERASLESQRASLEMAGNSTDVARQRATIDTRIKALAERKTDLDRQIAREQSDIETQRSALSKKRSELARQQSELAKRQKEVEAKANAQLNKVLDEALASGAAKPVDR
ncbi:MAG TPA: M56 family metallopeptidase [Dyella sp.]|uniref:M56 family metallopeptidase n=1 Tax=Dyella sp. TaxID=1869338 RepID=UPI002F94B4D7